MRHIEIESLEALYRLAVEGHKKLSGYAFQNLDFSVEEGLWTDVHFSDCLFLGCKLPAKLQDRILKENLVYPMIEIPFNPFISHLYDALAILCDAKSFNDEMWLDTALAVMRKYPQESGYESLGIPTWLYGHEPTTPFATHIAKYFDNSIREDCILSIAKGGIVYTPGSAGTIQEIFQDATQNHYETFGYASPMVFMGIEFWTKEIPIYSLLTAMMQSGRYKNLLLTLTDDVDEVVEAVSIR